MTRVTVRSGVAGVIAVARMVRMEGSLAEVEEAGEVVEAVEAGEEVVEATGAGAGGHTAQHRLLGPASPCHPGSSRSRTVRSGTPTT